MSKKSSPELLLPGGSLASALAAFQGGADAVYLGLESFSARKGAANFTWEDLDRLRGAAEKSGKKIYVALNTLVADREIPSFVETLAALAVRRVDGVILQDPSLAWMVNRHFPGLVLHGSTQMAVHNLPGVEEAARLGLRRVVLSRELTLKEIRNIREQFPGMELEVFVQGALCYGFSGLCLASGTMLDRSANRGECAQVCRTWFQGGGGRKAYDFSTNDLSLGEDVRELAALGVHSLKIEGRMKGPEYTLAAARWYRGILSGESPEVLKQKEEHLRLAFSRTPTRGFFPGSKGQDLLGTDYPGARGLRLGKVEKVSAQGFLLTLETDLAPRDGLAFWSAAGEECRTAVKALRDPGGARIAQAVRGRKVWVEAQPVPGTGQVVHKVSRHDGQQPQSNPLSYPPKPLPVDLKITATQGGLHIQWSQPLGEGTLDCPADLQESGSGETFREALAKAFTAGEGAFTLGRLEWENKTGWMGVFLPPKDLKALRKAFYQELEAPWKAGTEETVRKTLEALDRGGKVVPWDLQPPPASETFTPWDQAGNGGALPETSFWRYLPALEFSLEGRAQLLARWQAETGVREFVGLNNLSHLNLLRRLRESAGGVPPGLRFFTDYGLYASHRVFSQWLAQEFPEVEALTPWVERPGALERSLLPAAPWAAGRPLPLFYSRICWRRHSLGRSCEGCTGFFEEEVSQGKTRFRVSGQNCLTLVYRLSGSPTPGAGRS